jgi:hypothetical protein
MSILGGWGLDQLHFSRQIKHVAATQGNLKYLPGLELKGPKLEIFGVFIQIRPVWAGNLETRPKNPKLGWFRSVNRQFVLFSTEGYNAKRFFNDIR